MQTIDRSKIAKELEAFCDKYNTYGEAAQKLGITLAQLSTARNDENSVIPAKALAKLGYGYTLVYVRKADMPAKRTPKAKKAKTAKPAAKKTAKPKSKPAAKKPVKKTATAKKAPPKAKAKKPAKKAADKPAPAAPKTEQRVPATLPPRTTVTVSAPPRQQDTPAAQPPAKVVQVTDSASFDA